MKVGILSQWYPPEPGSAAVTGVLAQALSRRGHHVTVVTGFPNYPLGRVSDGYRMRIRSDEKDGEVLIRRVALYPSHDRSKIRRALNYGSFAISASLVGTSLLRNTDAVWVYNSPATVGLPSALSSVGCGPPHLMHVMDLWPDSIRLSGLATGRSYRAMSGLLDRWCNSTYRRAGAIACISEGLRSELIRRAVPAEKLHHVPIWTDENRYHPRPPDATLRSALGIEDSLTVVYAGNLGDGQGLDRLLEVCQRVGDLDLRVLIAGSGTAEDRLRTTARRLRLSNVTFLGRWPAEDMGRLLSVADFALVSLSSDPLSAITMPSKVPAILASGRPVLAWATGDVADTISSGQCGFVAPPGDITALEAAFRRASQLSLAARRALGEASRVQYTRRFALERGVDAIETLLAGMTCSPRSRRDTGDHSRPIVATHSVEPTFLSRRVTP